MRDSEAHLDEHGFSMGMMILDQRRLTPVLGSPALDCRRRLAGLPSVIFNPGRTPATRAPSTVSPRAYATVVKERLGPNQNESRPSSDSNVRNAHRMEMPVASRPTKAPRGRAQRLGEELGHDTATVRAERDPYQDRERDREWRALQDSNLRPPGS